MMNAKPVLARNRQAQKRAEKIKAKPQFNSAFENRTRDRSLSRFPRPSLSLLQKVRIRLDN